MVHRCCWNAEHFVFVLRVDAAGLLDAEFAVGYEDDVSIHLLTLALLLVALL